MPAGDTPPCLRPASLSEGRLPHQQVVVLDVNFMNDSLAETPEDKHGSEADHVNPDSRNGRRGGAPGAPCIPQEPGQRAPLRAQSTAPSEQACGQTRASFPPSSCGDALAPPPLRGPVPLRSLPRRCTRQARRVEATARTKSAGSRRELRLRHLRRQRTRPKCQARSVTDQRDRAGQVCARRQPIFRLALDDGPKPYSTPDYQSPS